MSRLLSSRTSTATMFTNASRAIQAPLTPIIPLTRSYHQTFSLQDKASTPSPSSRPQQNKSRGTFFWRRRDRKETRNRISTLALDQSTTEAEHESYQNRESGSKGHRNGSGRSKDRLMSQNQRTILLFTVIFSIPIIGRDVMEFIVPGILGSVIFVGGKVKSGIKWVKSIGS